MPLYEFEGRRPTIHPSAFVAPTATIVGDVTIEAEASVWYGAVLRADYGPVIVREGANVQDGSVLHAPPELPVEIGPGVTVAHLCVIHGAILGTESLVANGAIVLDGARIGARAMVAAGAVVKPGMEVPDGMLAVGVPAAIKGPIAGTQSEFWVKVNPGAYRALGQRHLTGVTLLEP